MEQVDNDYRIPIVVCDKCCDFTEELTMGKTKDKCDLCGAVLEENYHWRWGLISELNSNAYIRL